MTKSREEMAREAAEHAFPQAHNDSDIPGTVAWERARAERAEVLIESVQGALGTEETGEALIEVARNAHKAELELASLHREYDDEDPDDGLRGTGERGS